MLGSKARAARRVGFALAERPPHCYPPGDGCVTTVSDDLAVLALWRLGPSRARGDTGRLVQPLWPRLRGAARWSLASTAHRQRPGPARERRDAEPARRAPERRWAVVRRHRRGRWRGDRLAVTRRAGAVVEPRGCCPVPLWCRACRWPAGRRHVRRRVRGSPCHRARATRGDRRPPATERGAAASRRLVVPRLG